MIPTEETLPTIKQVLGTVKIILDIYPDLVDEKVELISQEMMKYSSINDTTIMLRISQCWLTIIKLRRDILLQGLDFIFTLALHGIAYESYEVKMVFGDMFFFLISDTDVELMENEKLKSLLQANFIVY